MKMIDADRIIDKLQSAADHINDTWSESKSFSEYLDGKEDGLRMAIELIRAEQDGD